jgi:Protein of unknown function (DUF3105)
VPTTTQTQAASATTKRVILAIAALAVVVLGYFILKPVVDPAAPHGGDPHTDNPALKAVQTFDYVGAQHTTDPVTYAQTPPAGGPHDPQWQDCGTYTQQLRNENAVHSLEHGTVWVTYRPDLSSADVATLQSALDAVKDHKTILSPYPGLPAPAVVTVWNAQLDLKSASDPRLATFIQVYGDGHTAPEAAIASCAGGKVVYASSGNP